MKNLTILFLTLFLFTILNSLHAQQITGVWKGKIDRKKVEVKIIKNGDSLTGTSYYYESSNNYRRYTIKGYFDELENSAIWWDDELIEEKGTRIFSNAENSALLSVADFNCPGSGKMFLDGRSSTKEDRSDLKGPVDLTKVGTTSFPDEWDYVIDNYTVGTNDPYIIDSVELIARTPIKEKPVNKDVVQTEIRKPKTGMVSISPPPAPKPKETIVQKPQTIEEKFVTRKKIFNTQIAVSGDSIELRFYDNAQIDGDSITLFLNDKMIFQHIKLTAKAYTIKLPVKELLAVNELTMVAENLGSIPPNTAYMMAIVEDKRHEAYLSSTEETSAVIRLVKNE